ncbi:hypothetical protein [Leifsonia sp. Leaf264]|uniref:hypothetical protein n=1 Tax=Leifsonia sp. Leaf264 TaxID=1736314 RepID=UPI0006F52C17|nr:hypothetical protein [Leifsonia sp. Leaf264]KQO98176.1 hypothetical protein ASF30_08940 [Leifsonia sp. Leaf264]
MPPATNTDFQPRDRAGQWRSTRPQAEFILAIGGRTPLSDRLDIKEALEACTNHCGETLRPGDQDAILRFFDYNDEETWEDAYDIQISRTSTLWSALLERTSYSDYGSMSGILRGTTTTNRWKELPTREQVRSAIFYSRDQRRSEAA